MAGQSTLGPRARRAAARRHARDRRLRARRRRPRVGARPCGPRGGTGPRWSASRRRRARRSPRRSPRARSCRSSRRRRWPTGSAGTSRRARPPSRSCATTSPAVATVSEGEIEDAIRFLARDHGVVAEGAGAVAAAGVRTGRVARRGGGAGGRGVGAQHRPRPPRPGAGRREAERWRATGCSSADEAFWRGSNQMGVPEHGPGKQLGADHAGLPALVARPGEASTKHRHYTQQELYMLLEGAGRARIEEEVLTSSLRRRAAGGARNGPPGLQRHGLGPALARRRRAARACEHARDDAGAPRAALPGRAEGAAAGARRLTRRVRMSAHELRLEGGVSGWLRPQRRAVVWRVAARIGKRCVELAACRATNSTKRSLDAREG